MPFYVAGLALLYYVPYILYSIINADLRSLRDEVKKGLTADEVVGNYFDNKKTTSTLHR